MKTYVVALALGASCLSSGAIAQELSYRLPQATMVAGWQARITHCPTREDANFRYTSNVSVAGVTSPGELVRLNPSSPFLGSRKIALTFHDNGMLKTINAEGSGQGGAVLAGLIKSAAGFAALGVPLPGIAAMGGTPLTTATPTPPPPPPNVVCKQEIGKALDRQREVEDAIETIEKDVIAGTPLGATRTAVYEDLKEEQAKLEDELTLSTGVKLNRTRTQALAKRGADGAYHEYQSIDPIDVGEWLVADSGFSLPTLKAGQHGFCARFSATKADWDASVPISTPGLVEWRRKNVSGNMLVNGRMNRFVSLSPVPVTIDLWLRTSSTGDCSVDAVRGKKLSSKTVMVPQLSDYFILPLGSGLFESKSTSAEYADDSRPLSIGTSNTGGGAQFAEAMAGALAAAETMQGAKTATIQRRIERIKAENELNGLMESSQDR